MNGMNTDINDQPNTGPLFCVCIQLLPRIELHINDFMIGGIHKLRKQGRGLPKDDITLKAYLVKMMSKGEEGGGSKIPKN